MILSRTYVLCIFYFQQMISAAWDSLREKFNIDERCDKPSCVDGVVGKTNQLVYPPDRSQIGRANWRYVHTRASSYPESPSEQQRMNELHWIHSFVYTYPCSVCARDFVQICNRLPPRVETRDAHAAWWSQAHNAVNRDLSKPQFKMGG